MWRLRRLRRTLMSVLVVCVVGFCLLHYDRRNRTTNETDNMPVRHQDINTRQGRGTSGIHRMNEVTLGNNLKEHPQSRNYSSEVISPQTTLPIIYFITPTIARLEQKADLTRLSHTLRLVPRLHWIVVEDSEKRSRLVIKLLARCKVPYTHLAMESSRDEIRKLKELGKLPGGYVMPSGAEQRNLALEWVTMYARQPSVFYFGDDDNTYDLQLFEEMRFTKKVSVWPVGLIGEASFQTPVVKNAKVVGWAAGWGLHRKYPVDMAAFSVNTDVLKGPTPPRFHVTVGHGLTETDFLEQIAQSENDFEPKADNCTKILVWHTKTQHSDLSRSNFLTDSLNRYNLTQLEV